jgi:WD40 repeat protein
MNLFGRARRCVAVPFLAVGLLFLAGKPVAAASQVFQVDTGGHQGDIRDVVFTADGKQIVSAGEDKGIRVWDWRSGRTVRTIRGQIEPGNSGKIFALALSPDERWLAAAGWMDSSDAQEPCCGDIRLFDYGQRPCARH